MTKSICEGCKYWKRAEMFGKNHFHFCSLVWEYDWRKRKKKCNGKYKEEEE